MGEGTPDGETGDGSAQMERARARRLERRARVVLAVVGVVVTVAVAWILGPGAQWWLVHVDSVKVGGKGGLEGKDLADALDTVRGRAMTMGTGLLAAVAIYYTANNAVSARRSAQAASEGVEAARRSAEVTEAAQLRTFELTQQGQRQSEEAQRRTHELTEEGQRRTHELTERGQNTDRFTAAVAQLGDTTPAVQLGGVHALAGLADDAPTKEFRQTCIDVLCAFLRLPYDLDPGDDPADGQDPAVHAEARKAYRAVREVRHTIIRLIGNHLRQGAPVSWQGHDLDFTDVVFDGGDLHGAVFTDGSVSFRDARFEGGTVDFVGVRFVGGTVNFVGAMFVGGTVNFMGTLFVGGTVNFGLARFEGGTVNFRSARFEGGTVNFRSALFKGSTVDFRSAMFVGGTVNFVGAMFVGGTVNFIHARFLGGTVNFVGARFLGGTVNFGLARFEGNAVIFRSARFEGGKVDFEEASGRRPGGLPDGMADHLSQS
ncbi:pentapeptide repeat-containing protein [Actinomadura macra]|uniref:pentapeptide repeat-containing protein n=1 Tax=Actinomadura macra TaxID=46164 RepID=UPI000831C551|nr:pentapeptide repeat-containing protein [Actinomadura macra]